MYAFEHEKNRTLHQKISRGKNGILNKYTRFYRILFIRREVRGYGKEHPNKKRLQFFFLDYRLKNLFQSYHFVRI